MAARLPFFAVSVIASRLGECLICQRGTEWNLEFPLEDDNGCDW
jgi:hypothetical protein